MKKNYRVPWWVFFLALVYAIYIMFSEATNSTIGYKVLTSPQTKPEDFVNFTFTNFANVFWSNLFSWFLILLFISWIIWKFKKGSQNDQIESSRIHKTSDYPSTNNPHEITTYVVGVTFDDRQKIINLLNVGDRIDLRRERSNPYDPNAICVCFNKSYRTSAIDGKFGYINRDLAQEIAPIFDVYVPKDDLPPNGKIIEITNKGTDHVGVKIKFLLPNEKDYEIAMIDEFYNRF